MLILVEQDNEKIFKGEADDFLYEKNLNEELEMTLNEFEESREKQIQVYDEDGNLLTITKMRQLIY